MSLYRHDATGFLCEYAASPGAGYTAVSAMPGDVAGRVTWWRQRCVDTALGQSSAWHPSLPSSTELALPPGAAGRGVNIVPARYSAFYEADIPPVNTTNATAALTSGSLTPGSIRGISSVANGTVWLAEFAGDYNIPIEAYRRWIVSAYAAPNSAGARAGKLVVKTNAAGTEYEVPFTTSATLGAFARVFGAVDLSADGSNRCVIGLRMPTTSTAGAIKFDGIMLEELIGDTVAPSAWVVGGGSTVQDGQILSLPGDVVGGLQVLSSSIHAISTVSNSSQSIPFVAGGDPTGGTYHESGTISFPANNYRTQIVFFINYLNLNIAGIASGIETKLMQQALYKSGALVPGYIDGKGFIRHTGGNYFDFFTNVLIHNPGTGSASYTIRTAQAYNSAAPSDMEYRITALELSK